MALIAPKLVADPWQNHFGNLGAFTMPTDLSPLPLFTVLFRLVSLFLLGPLASIDLRVSQVPFRVLPNLPYVSLPLALSVSCLLPLALYVSCLLPLA